MLNQIFNGKRSINDDWAILPPKLNIRRIVTLMLVGAFSLQTVPVNAQVAPAHTPSHTASNAVFNNNNLNLDLSSTSRNMPAPNRLGGNAVTIQTGTTSLNVTSQTLLTPAERLAVWQIMSSGQQTIQLTDQGNATGGQFSINSWLSQRISNLVIPKGVTSNDTASNLQVAGNISNFGILSVQPISQSSATISATNIFNNTGASIASTVPLSLIATGTVSNAGQIRSAGSLSITAANGIVNALPTGVSGPAPSMTATSVNLNTNNLVNSGLIAATSGNLSLNSPAASNIVVNNTGGTLAAYNGDINVRDQSFTDKYDFNLEGGNLLSNNFNVNSGSGHVVVIADQVSGVVNINAGTAYVQASTTNLQLGEMNLNGDPAFFNTGGSVSLTSTNLPNGIQTNGAGLTIMASQDITTTGNFTISTSPTGNGAGGNMFIVAGANFTSSPTSSGQVNNDTTSILSLTGGSNTGGKIDLGSLTAPITTTGSSGPGGDVTIIAFGGVSGQSTPLAGTVNIPSGINAAGGGSTNGSVSIFAGAQSDVSGASPRSAINIGNIITNGGSPSANSVSLITGSNIAIQGNFRLLNGSLVSAPVNNQPGPTSLTLQMGSAAAIAGYAANQLVTLQGQTSNSQPGALATIASVNQTNFTITLQSLSETFTSNPTLSPSPVISATGVNAGASIAVGQISTDQGQVVINAGNNVTLNGAITTIGAPVTITAGNNVTFTSPNQATGASIVTSGTVPGNNISIFAGGNIVANGTGFNQISTANQGVSGGSLMLIAGVNSQASVSRTISAISLFDSLNSTVTATTQSATGGNITLPSLFTAFQIPAPLQAEGNPGGGDVTLMAFGGPGVGFITVPAGIDAWGNGAHNGNVTVIAGAQADTASPIGTGVYLGDVAASQAGAANAQQGAIGIMTAASLQIDGNLTLQNGSIEILNVSNGPLSGNNVVINIPNTTGFLADQEVIVSGPTSSGSTPPIAQELALVSAVSSSSITVQSLTNTYVVNSNAAIQVSPVVTLLGSNLTKASITVGSLTTNGAPVTLSAGGNISQSGAISTANGPVLIAAGGNITMGSTSSITTGGSVLGRLTGPANLTIFAGGNISNAATTISTAGTAANPGADILMAAGVSTQAEYVQSLTFVPNFAQFELSNPTISALGASATGGAISMSNLTSLSTVGSSGKGGNVALVAFNGSNANAGTVNLGAAAITAGGTGSNVLTTPNGNVIVIAGATTGNSITVGSIDTSNNHTGPTSAGGEVYLVTATPAISSNVVVQTFYTVGVTGSYQGNGTFTAGTIQPGSITQSGDISTNVAPVVMAAGGNITFGGTITTSGSPPIDGSNTLQAIPGTVAIIAGGSVSTSGATTIDTSTTATGFAGGDVLLVAGAQLQHTLTLTIATTPLGVPPVTGATLDASISITGQSASGGSINASSLNGINTQGGPADTDAPGEAGGNISLLAMGGSIATDPNGLFQTRGTSDGTGTSLPTVNTNGSVLVLAGAQSGTSISLGSIDTFDTTTVGSGGGSLAGGGDVAIATANPVLSNGAPLVLTINESCATHCYSTSGSFTSGPILQASAVVGTITAEGGQNFTSQSGDNSTLTAATAIAVTAGQNLTIGSVQNLNNSLPGGTPATGTLFSSSTINLTAGGTLHFTGNSITVNASAVSDDTNNPGRNGGTIVVSAQSIVYDSPVSFTADGTGGTHNGALPFFGNGGSISITTTGNSAGAQINVDSDDLTISAMGDTGGGNGGQVTLVAGSSMSIDPSVFTVGPQPGSNSAPVPPPAGPPVSTGNGATIDLTATGSLFINGTLDASGSASSLTSSGGNPGGNGGRISITVINPSAPFNIGGASSGGNGVVTGGILQASGDLTTGAPGTMAAQGNGGTIIVKNSAGIIVQSGALLVNAANAVDASSVQTPSDVSSFNGYYAGAGGHISLQAISGSVLSMGSLSGNGGQASTTLPSGDGGSIEIVTASNTPFVVGSTVTTNGVNGTLFARGDGWDGNNPTSPTSAPTAATVLTPSGSGGSVSVTNSVGGIFVDNTSGASNISVAAAGAVFAAGTFGGSGGTIKLSAPSGSVISTASLDASGGANSSSGGQGNSDGGNGGLISITSNGAGTAFQINPGSFNNANGVNGTLTANGFSGGTVSVTEMGTGGISVGANGITVTATAPAGQTSPNTPGGNGGNISLQAPNGPVSIASGLDVSGSSGNTETAPGFANGGNAGTIQIVCNTDSGTPFVVGTTGTPSNGVAGALTANGGIGVGANGNGGQVLVTNMGAGGIQLVFTNGTPILVTGPAANAAKDAKAGNGGVISLQAPAGPVSIDGSLDASGGAADGNFTGGLGGAILITNNSGSTTFDVGGESETRSTGDLTATGWQGGQITLINVGQNSKMVIEQGALSVAAFPASQTVDRSTAGPGGFISLQAPQGTILIKGDLDASGGTGCCSAGPLSSTGSLPPPNPTGTSTFNVGSNPNTAGFYNGELVEITGTAQVQDLQSTATVTTTVVEQIGGLSSNSITVNNLYTTFVGSSVLFEAFNPSGNGGQIAVVTNSSHPFAIGTATTTPGSNGTTGVLSANGYNGGIISVTNLGAGGVTLINPAKVSVTAASASIIGAGGNGGSLFFNATGAGGTVYIGGSLNVNGGAAGAGQPGGAGGVIGITVNTTTGPTPVVFILGGAQVGCQSNCNGVAGTLSATGASGGSIGVKDLGQVGITFTPANILVTASAGNGGNIDLEAPAQTAVLTSSAAGTLSVDGVTFAGSSASGGTITLNAGSINTTAGVLALSAQGAQASLATGSGGTVSVTTTNASQTLTVGASSNLTIAVAGASGTLSDGNIVLSSAGGINVLGSLATCTGCLDPTGTMTLSASGSGGIQNSSSAFQVVFATGTLNLNAGTGTIDLNNMKVSHLSFNSQGGTIYLANSGDLTINTSSQSGTGGVNIFNNGSITLDTNGNSGNVITSGGSVALFASGNAADINVNQNLVAPSILLAAGHAVTGSGILYAGQGLDLIAGSGGIGAAQALNTSTGTLSIGVAGDGTTNVAINNSGNVLLSLTTSTQLNNLSIVNSAGNIATSGAINMAKNVSLTVSTQGSPNEYAIILGASVGENNAASTVTLSAGGSIQQTGAGNSIQANAISLSSLNGNVGIAASPISITAVANGQVAGTLSVTTGGGGAAFIVNSSTTGVSLAGVQTGGDFQLNTAGSLNVNAGTNVTSAAGSVTLHNTSTTTGNISVNGNVIANMGPVIIENDNTAGTITVAPLVDLVGSGRKMDFQATPSIQSLTGVALLSGAFPQSPTQGSISANVIVNINGAPVTTLPANAPTAYFGSAGVTASAQNAATVNANNGADVVFNGTNSGSIVLGSGVTITASKVVQAISSLDLTLASQSGQQSPSQSLFSLQQQGGSGVHGSLQVNASGVATGGSVSFDNTVSLVDLNGFNIPAGIQVSFTNFSSSNPVAVNIPQQSSNDAIISGTVQFTGASSNGQLFVNSSSTASTTNGRVLSIRVGGLLTGANNLSVDVGGNVKITGTLSTTGANSALQLLSGAADPGITTRTTPGTITISGSVLAGNISSGIPTDQSTLFISSAGSINQNNAVLGSTITSANISLQIGGTNPLQYPNSTISAGAIESTQSLTISAASGGSANIAQVNNNINVGPVTFTSGTGSFTLSQNSPVSISGSTSGAMSITSGGSITTTNNLVCGTCTFSTSSLILSNGSTISNNSPLGTISISAPSGQSLTITGNNNSILAGSQLAVNSTDGSVTLNNVNLSTQSGQLSVNANEILSVTNSNFSAGQSTGFISGTLSPGNILTSGSISFSAGLAIIVTDAATNAHAVGGDITMTVTNGPLNLSGGHYQADGGNIVLLSSDSAIGNQPYFTANAVGTTATNSVGGGIEVGAGLTSSNNLANAFNQAPGSVPLSPVFLQVGGLVFQPFGNHTAVNNTASQTIGVGVVQQNVSDGGLINVSTSSIFPAFLNLNGGAIVFDAVNGSSVQYDGASFTVNAFLPIAYRPSAAASLELEEDDGAANANDAGAVATIFTHEGAQVMTAQGVTNGYEPHVQKSLTPARRTPAVARLNSGDLLINLSCDTNIRTHFGDIHAKKGALLSASMQGRQLRIAALTGPGHVTVVTGGKTIELSLGQELVVSDRPLDSDDLSKADGVGRRTFRTITLGSGLYASVCEVSLISLISQAEHMEAIRHPHTALEKKIAAELIRSAAALQVVTQGRGGYQARPRERKLDEANEPFKPVRYTQ